MNITSFRKSYEHYSMKSNNKPISYESYSETKDDKTTNYVVRKIGESIHQQKELTENFETTTVYDKYSDCDSLGFENEWKHYESQGFPFNNFSLFLFM